MHFGLALLLLGAALAGCAGPSPPPPPLMSPYPASGYGYGYAEERIGPDLLRVVYHGPLRPLDPAGPARAPQLDRAASEAADLALWRAAQLALAENKPAFAVIERRADTETLRRPGGWAYDPWWPYYCYPGYWPVWGCRAWPPTYVPPIADGRARHIDGPARRPRDAAQRRRGGDDPAARARLSSARDAARSAAKRAAQELKPALASRGGGAA